MDVKMMMRLVTPSLLGLSVLCFPALGQAQQAEPERFIEYTVKKGDTCTGIAKQVYGSGKLCYKMISKYNKMDRKFVIVPGQTLRLPTKEDLGVKDPDPDAVLSAKKGNVQARSPSTDKWKDATRGESLWRLWRVNSGERSSAEVSFTRIEGKLELRQNTLVIIYGPKDSKVEAPQASRAILERGALRSRLAELGGEQSSKAKPALVVETPAAAATLKAQGQTLFDVDKDGTTRVANLDNADVSLEGQDGFSVPTAEDEKPKPKPKRRKRKAIALPKNTGSKVEPGKDPSPPKPLPAPPVWEGASPLKILSLNGKSAAIVGWSAQADAAQYRVELANKDNGAEVLDAFTIDAKFKQVTLENLPTQSYYARVSTIDADKFEGLPSAPLKIEVINVEPKAPEGLRVAQGQQVAPVYVGSTFEVPGLKCDTSPEARDAQASLTLSAPGPQTVYCVDEQGHTSALALEVQPIKVTGLNQPLTLKPSQTATLTFTTSPPTQEISLMPPQGVKVISQNQRPDGTWEVTLQAAPEGFEPGPFKVGLSTGAAQPLALGELMVSAQQADAVAQPMAPAQDDEPVTLRFGAIGATDALYNKALSLDGAELGQGFAVGLRADYLLQERVWLGLDTTLGQTGMLEQARRAQTFAASLYGAWQITDSVLAPYLRLGVGAQLWRYNTGYSNADRSFDPDARQSSVRVPVEAGLGLRLELGKYMSLSADFVEHVQPWGLDSLGLSSSARLGLMVHY